MALGGLFGGGSSSSSSSANNNSNDSTPPTSTSSIFSSSSGGSDSSSIKTRLQTAIQTQSNVINAKFLIQKINENCFDHCIPDPQASLSGKEQVCLSSCMEKYIDAWNVTSKTYVARLQKEGAQLGGMVGSSATASRAAGRELF